MAIPVVEFQVKNGNFKTRDFSPLIERVLAGVIAIGTKPQFRSNNKQMAHFDANGAIDFFALRMVSFPFYAVIVSAHLWNKFIMVLIKAVKSKKSTSKVKPNYTGSLAPADFSGAVFTCVHFQKIAQISSLYDFHYISERIPSPMHFWLLMT